MTFSQNKKYYLVANLLNHHFIGTIPFRKNKNNGKKSRWKPIQKNRMEIYELIANQTGYSIAQIRKLEREMRETSEKEYTIKNIFQNWFCIL